MIKQFLTVSCILLSQAGMAQTKGILPLNGIRYSSEGIWAKNIAVKIDGQQLVSNRVPLTKEIAISVAQPTGFTENAKIIYAGAELSVLSARGEVLMKNPNIFLKNEATGFDTRTVKELVVKFGIMPEMLRGGNNCTVAVRFYDIKGKGQLRLDFPVAITRPGEALQLTKAAMPLNTNDPSFTAMACGLTTKGVKVSADTSIYVAPKMAYAVLDIPGISGPRPEDVLNGTETFWVYDANMNEVKVKDILLKEVRWAMEGSTVDYSLKIPYRLKTVTDKGYTVRFRWESDDRKKLIDVVVKK